MDLIFISKFKARQEVRTEIYWSYFPENVSWRCQFLTPRWKADGFSETGCIHFHTQDTYQTYSMYFKSHCPLHILLDVQMACLFHVTMKIYLPIQMHIHTYIYLHEYKYKFIPFIGTYLFSFLSALKFREAPSLLSTSAPEQILTAALQYFPRVSPPLGGSRESYHHLPLINRVGTLDIHLPE